MTLEPTKSKRSAMHLLILFLAALVFFAVGGRNALHSSPDFVPVYTGSRCLLHGCNPYKPADLQQQYLQGGGRAEELPSWDIDVPVYPPSAFLALFPFALLRFPVARVLWFLINGCLFITSVGLVLSMCPPSHRWLSTSLGSFILATGGILLALGQPTIFVISLIVIGSYLFLRARAGLLPLAAFVMMLSLAVKPQMGGLIVLYFVAQRFQRRYAALAAVGAIALLLSAGLILKLRPRSAGWISDLRANVSSTLKPGAVNDPRPSNPEAIGDANLQTITSVVFADEQKFNDLAYLIFLALLSVWIIAVLRTEADSDSHLLALGALSVLSLTPVYHRFYDTRLLLLTLPAVLIVFQKRRLLGALAAVLTVLAVVSVQYRIQMFLLQRSEWQSVLQNKWLFVFLLRQQNLELVILFGLYVVAILSPRIPDVMSIESARRSSYVRATR